MGLAQKLLSMMCILSFLLMTCGGGEPENRTAEPKASATEIDVGDNPSIVPQSELSDCIPCDPSGPCAPAYQSFAERHPEVRDFRCCKRRSMRDKWCEFIYESGGQTYEVEFSESGEWLETEEENIGVEAVPEHILADVRNRFPEGEIIKCERETTQTGVFYEIDLRFPDGGENEYYYNARGAYLVGQNRYED